MFQFNMLPKNDTHKKFWKSTSSNLLTSDISNSTSRSKTSKFIKCLKRCKSILTLSRSNSSDSMSVSSQIPSSSSWYLESDLNSRIQIGKINYVEDCFKESCMELLPIKTKTCEQNKLELSENLQKSYCFSEDTISKSSLSIDNFESVFSSVSDETFKSAECDIISIDKIQFECNENEITEDNLEIGYSLPYLEAFEEIVNDPCNMKNNRAIKAELTNKKSNDVSELIEKYFGDIYGNFIGAKRSLIRQARDILVCNYHGCLNKFENEFCTQASRLLRHLKNRDERDTSSPSGWPLCLGESGVVVHLAPLDPSILRNRDCYLCVSHLSGLEVVLTWKLRNQIQSQTLAAVRTSLHAVDDIMCSSLQSVSGLEEQYADDYDEAELPEMLQNLLVSVEHAILKVPLDDLTFPCPQCEQYVPTDRLDIDVGSCACQCLCLLPDSKPSRKDSSIQTSPMFEFVNSIPHIDSDSDDDKESIRLGLTNKKLEIARPKTISELPDKLLMSGINLPGTVDTNGRPIILCYAECISRAALNKYEIAKLLLYYTSIQPDKSKNNGFTVLLLAENECDYKTLELLDKSICLIRNYIKVVRYLIWKPHGSYKEERSLSSEIEAIFITSEASLATYLTKDQAPASCNGTCTHDQLEWVEFFKQLEPFLATCKAAGQSLLKTLSNLRKEEVPNQITRRFLNHQCRQISKALDSESVQKLKREGHKTLQSLSERSQWLASSQDVQKGTKSALDSFNAVERVTKRLEQLKQERMEKLKELGRYRILEGEAEELSKWTQTVGHETINRLTLLLCAAEDSTSVKEVANSFDDFFFNAWKQIEKSNDITDECRTIKNPKGQHLKEITNKLNSEMKAFRESLEETRERIEDSSRCFLLLETCHDILEDDNAEQEEFFKLAKRSANEKLLQLCENFTSTNTETDPHDLAPDKNNDPGPTYSSSEFSASSTPQKSNNTQIRRRSVSSLAFIYHCSHHAAGEMCNCYESDTENTVSYKLKKRYIQMQSCSCQTGNGRELERKNSAILGEIKEEHESVENLLERMENLDKYRRCDSGLSTADNSIGDDSSVSCSDRLKKKLQRTCSCQYYNESCTVCSTESSSGGSNHDNMDNQQDSIIEEGTDNFIKSHGCDDIEEDQYLEERRKIPPVTANNHLYCHDSTLDLPTDALYNNMDEETQKNLTYAIKEMIATERSYVQSLDYIITNYIPELQREDIPQALRGQRNTVFGNVEKIYEFHSRHFLGELEECENNPLQVGQIFLKYGKRFYLYALYNKNKPKSDSLMSEYGTIFFKSKQLELEDKMDLASYLLKPVQRMGKYALLLQEMMKYCRQSKLLSSAERTVPEIDYLRQAEEMVRFQLRHGNDLLAMDSIRECDVNLKEQGRLLRQNEFLVWEGKSGRKSLRQVFLFEELILFSKARRFPDRKNLDLYIYKNSIKMTDIGLTAGIGESPTKFEIWFRKRKPNDTFTLQSMSEEVKKAWTEELSQLLWKQAIRNRAVRMAEMSSMGIGNKPCLDIRPSADQISDRSISIAQLTKNFHSDFCTMTRKWRFNTMLLYNTLKSPAPESCRTIKRPHSVISVSSISSGSTSSGGSGGTSTNHTGSSTGLDSNCDSPIGRSRPYRSTTLNSQCSVESGIIADMSGISDDYSEQTHSTKS
ncbi:uncharacterized protein LOC126740062 isoform X3 [Anthonomus grandis grandis]|uniref:uncharacterized protein LOC126740062 isoform X3 n=1 Tax=Anthonomus grandis grandis TaxID=2921223 RepID=UPI0021651B6F|nr:uncharacterized protein LOC126740062 isoform X3 [Anthonomus grandis grandis]